MAEDKLQQNLFALTPLKSPKIAQLKYPIWTENKAKLIERYLFYFVLITKHGNYIDAFAGPQSPAHPDTWSAKLVMESQPRWLRNFYLYDIDKEKVAYLEGLRDAQPPRNKAKKEPRRQVDVVKGDSNLEVIKLLESRVIKPGEATFCLLDQHSTECDWATVKALAAYKSEPKIELFYFFPVGWLGRSIAANKDLAALDRWWGNDGWRSIEGKSKVEQTNVFWKRFQDELHYRYVYPWPIHKSKTERRVMYYMIHASDHPAASGLMYRAYHRAVTPPEAQEQARLELGIP